MKTVVLHGRLAAGRVVCVDDGDYDLVMQYRWTVKETKNSSRRRITDGPYAMAGIVLPDGRQSTISMHKLLTGWPQTDHIDHDGLNNRRSNLRLATAGQNGANRRASPGCSSQYKGVRWYPSSRKWCARIRCNGKLRHLGYFAREDDAARAYDAAALEAFGEYAHLNLPGEAIPRPGAA